MRSYYAKQASIVHEGGWLAVVEWGRCSLKKNNVPVQLLTARPGEKYARVIGEISLDGERLVNQGRFLLVKSLRG